MEILIIAFGLGLLGGVVPGSILTVLLISVIQGGYKAGLKAFLWCVLAEVTIVLVLLTILFSLPIPASTFNYIGLVGGLVLFYFAWQIFYLQKIEGPEKTNVTFSGLKIYLLAVTNAPLYIFWVTVCTPLIHKLSQSWTLLSSASSFMLFFEIGWCLSTFAVLLVFVKAREHLTNPRIMKRVYLGVSILMLALGVRMLHLSLSLLNVI